MYRLFLIIISLSINCLVQGQTKIRSYPDYINRPGRNNIAPYISMDGNSMVYLNDSGEDREYIAVFTFRKGVDWTQPSELPKPINSKLTFLGGYSLNPDGNILYFSSRMSNGVGGYDIYFSKRNRLSWGLPENLALPINSQKNDASPSVSIDGNTMYFMRCNTMSKKNADGCHIYSVKKNKNGRWGEPRKLPAIINTGNSQTPRILGDSKTLVFSSNKISPNIGGMDLYMSRLEKGNWGKPIALDFINTSEDDQNVSATWLGRYLTMDKNEKNNYSLVEVLIPENIRPTIVTKIEGSISGISILESAYISLINLADRRVVFSTRTDSKGNFTAFAEKGNRYKLSIDPEHSNNTFASKIYDLTGEKTPVVEKLHKIIKPAVANDEIILEEITFDSVSSEISANSFFELRRVVRFIESNIDKSFVIEVTHKNSVEAEFEEWVALVDSGSSTAEGVDSLVADGSSALERIDSLVKINNSALEGIDSLVKINNSALEGIDSLVKINNSALERIDSLVTYDTTSILQVKNTQADSATIQAKLIVNYLYSQGIDSTRVIPKGNVISETLPNNKNTLVKIIVH